jgi:hypothetical protein
MISCHQVLVNVFFFAGCHNFYIIEVLLIKKNVLIKHQMTVLFPSTKLQKRVHSIRIRN